MTDAATSRAKHRTFDVRSNLGHSKGIDEHKHDERTLVTETPRPAYRQIAAELRRRIQDKTNADYAPGATLPPEPDLVAEFRQTIPDVSRSTVNKAISQLRSEGWVRPERGRGTKINPLPILIRATIGRQARATREAGQARGAFAAEVAAAGFTPRSDVTVESGPAPDDVAEELGIEPGALVVMRKRVMYADDIPVQAATSYLPHSIVAGSPIEQEDTGPGGAYSRLADIGYPLAWFRERVRIRPPRDEEARVLRLDDDHRVYDIVRYARARDAETGPIVEVNHIALPAHQWELETEWPASE